MSYLLNSASRVLGGLAVGLGLLSVSVVPAGVQIARLADNGFVVLNWVAVAALVAAGFGLASAVLRRLADHEASSEVGFDLGGRSGSAA